MTVIVLQSGVTQTSRYDLFNFPHRSAELCPQATVASVRKVFPTLQSLDPSCIHISSKLQDFGDVLIELHADIWAEVLHSLMYVEVSTGDILQQRATEPTEMPRQAESE